ncbi:hypothetical protein Pelo_19839 [Pelomyxa schiedti]|nr:hypothetical protein Pelo_19839 [Pelomyxa schiedti]
MAVILQNSGIHANVLKFLGVCLETLEVILMFELMKCNLDTILYRKEHIPAELQDQAQLTYKRKLQLSVGCFMDWIICMTSQ